MLNENYFDTIDTEKKAYILGLIFADGFVSLKNHIVLASIDRELLDQVAKELGIEDRVKYSAPSISRYSKNGIFNLGFSSKHMASILRSYGKFKGSTLLPSISPELQRHFVRGYFDGDGCISLSTRNYTVNGKNYQYENIPTFNIICNKDNLDYFQNFFASFDIKTSVQKSKTESMIYIKLTSKKSCLLVKDIFYKNASIFLNRKYEKFNTLAL